MWRRAKTVPRRTKAKVTLAGPKPVKTTNADAVAPIA